MGDEEKPGKNINWCIERGPKGGTRGGTRRVEAIRRESNQGKKCAGKGGEHLFAWYHK